MYDYQQARDDEEFEYGVLTHLDGEGEAVSLEGYIKGDTMPRHEAIVVVVQPEQTIHIPFDRVAKIRYETKE